MTVIYRRISHNLWSPCVHKYFQSNENVFDQPRIGYNDRFVQLPKIDYQIYCVPADENLLGNPLYNYPRKTKRDVRRILQRLLPIINITFMAAELPADSVCTFYWFSYFCETLFSSCTWQEFKNCYISFGMNIKQLMIKLMYFLGKTIKNTIILEENFVKNEKNCKHNSDKSIFNWYLQNVCLHSGIKFMVLLGLTM